MNIETNEEKGDRFWYALENEEKIAFLLKWDLKRIKEDLENQDVEYLTAILTGDGWTQYSKMSQAMLDEEYECEKERAWLCEKVSKPRKLSLFDFME